MSWQPFSWDQVQGRFQPAWERTAETSQELMRLMVAFLTPAAVIAGALGAWRLSSDLGWTGEFFISTGLLSHWQVWFALAALLQSGAVAARRRLRSTAE